MIEILVKIITYESIDIPSLNMTAGTLYLTPNGYDSYNVIEGLFAKKWIGSISNGARVEQGGNLAYTGGLSLMFLATSDLYDTLRQLNVSEGNNPVEIWIRDSHTGTSKRIYNGVIATFNNDEWHTTVSVEDVTRNRKADSIEPFYLGEGQLIQMDKNEIVSEIVEPLVDQAPLFYTVYSDGIGARLLPYLVDPTEQQMRDWVTSVDTGKTGELFANGVLFYSIIAREWGDNWGLQIIFTEGNIRNGEGLVVAGAGEDIVPFTITDRLNTYEGDTYSNSGGFTDELLRFEDGTSLGEVYTDNIDFGSKSITSYEFDSVGYKNIPLDPAVYKSEFISLTSDLLNNLNLDTLNYINDGVFTNSADADVNVVYQDSANAVDGDYDTEDYTNVTITPNGSGNSNKVAVIYNYQIPPLDSSKTYYLNIIKYVNTLAPTGDYYNRSAIVGYARRSPSVGEAVVSNAIAIGDDFNSGGTDFTYSGTSFDLFNNYFPLLDNAPTSKEPFRWKASGEGLVDNASGFLIPVSELGSDIDIDAGLTVVVSQFLNATGITTNITSLTLRVRNLSVVEEVELPLDPIYTKWNGRKVGTDLVTNTSGSYDLACRLQNLRDQNITPPDDGWGSAEPTVGDWTNYIDTGSGYGGIYASSLKKEVVGSIAKSDELKRDMAIASVGLGAVNDLGIESLYSLVDGLTNTDGVLIKYGDLLRNTEPKRKALDQSQMFNEYVLNDVSVTGVELDTAPSGVDSTLWAMGSALYTAYGIKNRYKKDSIVTETDTPLFIADMLKWYGVVNETEGTELPDNWICKERYTVELLLPVSFVFDNDLFVGQKVRYDDVFYGICSGIVYNRAYDLQQGTVKIGIHCLGTKTVGGGDRVIYVETGEATDTIVESGSQTNTIVEGEE